MIDGAASEAVLFLHSTGTGPFLWAGVPDEVIGGRKKLLPANLGYAGDPVARGVKVGSRDDAAEVAKTVTSTREKIHVVAHSYGALVALQLLPSLEGRVASVFFYEPVAFKVLEGDAAGAAEAAAEMARFIDAPWFLEDEERGGLEAWQELFIDYWNRPGSWSKMPDGLKAMSLALGWKMFQEVRACFYDEPPAGGWQLTAPTTIAIGDRTTAASRAMSRALAKGRPNVTVTTVAGVGHMAPLTHAARVHEALALHMARFDASARG